MDGFKDRIRLALRNVSLDVIAEQRHFVNITLKAILIYGLTYKNEYQAEYFPSFCFGRIISISNRGRKSSSEEESIMIIPLFVAISL